MSDSRAYVGLEPRDLWGHFYALNRIPRPSGGEKAVRLYIQKIADSKKARWRTDAKENLVVYVPASSPALAGVPPTVIQSHLDMVCEKTPKSMHQFATDPIIPRRVDNYIYATDTTLGADNGIGVAAAMTLLTRSDLEHGPLELLFTVEEETGLFGAAALDTSLISARRLINLDSESVDALTVGSAAGENAILTLPLVSEETPVDRIGKHLVVTGLRGGHSGLQILEPLANAIKLLVEVLAAATARGLSFQVASLTGGNADNSIPRFAECHLAVSPKDEKSWDVLIDDIWTTFYSERGSDEKGLIVQFKNASRPERAMTSATSKSLLWLLNELPHGMRAMSREFSGEVETSSNLAQVIMEEKSVQIVASCRSFVADELEDILSDVMALAKKAGAAVRRHGAYPGWQPRPDSQLLKITDRIFRKVRGVKPEVRVTHGGLECGVIVSEIKGMDAISFGPTIDYPHTPHERVDIPSVAATWDVLTALLAELARIPVGQARSAVKV